MPRFKLTIEYAGTPFSGWQRQTGLQTVQQTLEDAFEDFLQTPTTVWGSGRTDAGVHAKGQVAHFDTEKSYTPLKIQGAMNKRLKHVPISILKVEEVDDSFHSRFSATSRSYEYRIFNRRTPPALEENRVLWIAHPLNVELMNEGAKHLIGHHDFTSFRDSMCQSSSPFKTLDELTVERLGDYILVKTRARSFLHHQVRNIVGTLKRVGEEAWAPSRVKEILEAKDRTQAGPTVLACGLYLTEVGFD